MVTRALGGSSWQTKAASRTSSETGSKLAARSAPSFGTTAHSARMTIESDATEPPRVSSIRRSLASDHQSEALSISGAPIPIVETDVRDGTKALARSRR
jgi:hypothetical protein